jgi:hypothetical protein
MEVRKKMNMTAKQLILALIMGAAAHGQVTVSGTISDDTGAVPPGASVQVTQVVAPQGNRNAVPIGANSLSQIEPFTATGVADSSGAFSISNVPVGTYIVCAYSTAQALLSNCQWTSTYKSVAVNAADLVIPPIIMKTGTVITVAVQDPLGMLNPIATNSHIGGTLPTGHYFHLGVIDGNGYYASARLMSQDGQSRSYAVTIPKSNAVSLFIDSDLSVSDSNGNSVATRVPSSAGVQGGADTILSLAVR